MDNFSTKFFDDDGEEVANLPGLLNITLFKGMEIEIHGAAKAYKVVSWSFKIDHEGGLFVYLKPT